MSNTKVGLFGGSFNPIHLGHIQSVVDVANKMELDKVFVIPAYLNPHKITMDGPTPEQRLEITRIGMEDYSEFVGVDDQEILRKGPSYTIETIRSYLSEYEPSDLHLILGVDTFQRFDEWKEFEEILANSNLIVTSRPGSHLPFSIEDIPKGVRPLVAAFDRNYIELTTGRHIEFIRIEDVDISATDVRKKLRTGHRVEKFLSFPVEKYIKDNNLYEPIGDKIPDFYEFTKKCTKFLIAKSAISVKSFDLTGLEKPSEYTLICSGTSTRHTVALAEQLHQYVKEEYGVGPLSFEGLQEGRWVVLDYGSLIVHVFYDYARQEYKMEDLWVDGKAILIEEL